MDMDVGDSGGGVKGAMKRLVATDGSLNARGQELSLLAGRVAGRVMLLEGTTPSSSNNTLVSTPEKEPIVKRRKQQGDDGVETEHDDEAASLEEGRQDK